MLLTLRRHLDGIAIPLGVVGLGAVAWHNWRMWQRDRTALARRQAPDPLPALTEWPRLPYISVLVAVWNESYSMEHLIHSFQALRYPHKQLVLCAGGHDNTYHLACQYACSEIIVLEQYPGEGKQRALRRCLTYASGDIIMLTDADCVLDSDSFERLTYPIATRQEQVCTGTVLPHPWLRTHPMVLTQAASQWYDTLYLPSYVTGLRGANSALCRETLESTRGLDAPAPTGTDYVLAKILLQAGVHIRAVASSTITTDFPTTLRASMRQQQRWLRNVLRHGQRFGAADEVRATLRTVFTGLVMLFLPCGAVVCGRACLVVWAVLFVHAWLSRVRYLRCTLPVLGVPLTWRLAAIQVPLLWADFLTWSLVLRDVLQHRSRKQWQW